MSQSQPLLWFCRWENCILKFDTKEERNDHVLSEHIENTVPMTLSQYQAERVFNGSLSAGESSGVSYGSQKDATPPPKKRTRALVDNDVPLSLPSPPSTSPTQRSPTHTPRPTFAALSSDSGASSPAIEELPRFPSHDSLFPRHHKAPASQESTGSSASMYAVDELLTQKYDEDEEDDRYQSPFHLHDSLRNSAPMPCQSPLSPVRLKRYTQSIHPLDGESLPSQPFEPFLDPLDDFDTPPFSQRELLTQAPYQSQDY